MKTAKKNMAYKNEKTGSAFFISIDICPRNCPLYQQMALYHHTLSPENMYYTVCAPLCMHKNHHPY